MSKKKSNTAETTSAHKWYLEPKDVIVLQSSNGEFFAIDQNCARVSRLCRQYMDEAESKIEKGATAPMPPFAGKKNSFMFPAAAAENATLDFVDFYADHQRVCPLSLTLLAEECKRVMAATHTSTSLSQTAVRPLSSNERRISGTLTKESTLSMFALGGVEVEGRLLLPLMRVPLNSEQLNVAISFMYLKNHLDMDPEKQSSFLLADFPEAKDPLLLLSISVVLGM